LNDDVGSSLIEKCERVPGTSGFTTLWQPDPMIGRLESVIGPLRCQLFPCS
jgi:hypothetical protein